MSPQADDKWLIRIQMDWLQSQFGHRVTHLPRDLPWRELVSGFAAWA